VFVGFKDSPLRAIIVMKAVADNRLLPTSGEEIEMHDLLIALAFVGMVVAPAIVAARVDNSPLVEEGE
jgi:hypothetical protein